MLDNTLKSQAFKLKGRLYTFTVLQLLNADKFLFAHQLAEVIAKAPRLFDNTPVVLDCTNVQEGDIDLEDICKCMREKGLRLVAIQGANLQLTAIAQSKGMAILHASSTHDKPIIEKSHDENNAHHNENNAHNESSVATVETIKTKLLTTPVRSGQQVVSKGADLIITSSVSHGAELLADGNIHVYGALRGRALAGMSGDRNARIFCQALEAELISIAGFYRLSDAIETHSGACQIYLQDEHIQIESLC